MHSTVADLDGPLHVADFGGSGRLVLLIHGLGGSHAEWSRVGRRLAETFRVLAVDLPGFGLSPLGDRRNGAEGFRRLLTGLLRSLGEPAVLVGHSLGGRVAVELAAHEPALVRALVAVNPWLPRLAADLDGAAGGQAAAGGVAGAAVFRNPRLARRILYARRVDVAPPELFARTVKLSCADPARVPADVRDAMLAVGWAQVANGVDETGFRQAADWIFASLEDPAGAAALVDAVQVPTLVLHGTADRLVPQAVFVGLDVVRPDWERIPLTGAGHAPQIEEPEWLAQVLTGWLARTAASVAAVA